MSAVLMAVLLASWPALSNQRAPAFQYTYYLFEVPTERQGCSDCYIPLLVTREPLEKADRPEAVVIITYERDSVWNLSDRAVRLDAGAVEAKERKVRFEGKVYRYQRVPREEVIRLLENPLGTIPIHRPAPPIHERNEPLLKLLLRDLSAAGKADGGRP